MSMTEGYALRAGVSRPQDPGNYRCRRGAQGYRPLLWGALSHHHRRWWDGRAVRSCPCGKGWLASLPCFISIADFLVLLLFHPSWQLIMCAPSGIADGKRTLIGFSSSEVGSQNRLTVWEFDEDFNRLTRTQEVFKVGGCAEQTDRYGVRVASVVSGPVALLAD